MKLFIFFYFFSIFNCLHTLDPLLNYFDNLIQELDLNLNFNDHFNKFLIPSYSEILKEIVPIHKLQTNSPEKPQNERILNTELFCNFGAQINVTKLNYLCSNKSVSREYYNGSQLFIL